MTRFNPRKLLHGVAALAVLLAAAAADAAPMAVPTVTDLGVARHYDYAITNDTLDDFVIVTIVVLPGDASLNNLFAPAGFQASYDSGLGLVDFLPGPGSASLFFAGTTLSGFGFDSVFLPGPSTFQALTLLGDTISGPTQAPVSAAAVPEPGTLTLLTLGLGSLASRRRFHGRRPSGI